VRRTYSSVDTGELLPRPVGQSLLGAGARIGWSAMAGGEVVGRTAMATHATAARPTESEAAMIAARRQPGGCGETTSPSPEGLASSIQMQ
jgi:hypothetical protein